MSGAKTPLDMMYQWERQCPSLVFVRQSLGNGEWQKYTWSEIASRVRRLASFFNNHQVRAGTRIGIWSSNSVDWLVSDLAVMMSGCVSVPLYPGQDRDTAEYVIQHSGMQWLLLGDFDQQDNVDRAAFAAVKTIALQGYRGMADYTLEEIFSSVEPLSESPCRTNEELFTIIYSSGTTGRPKGVMHAFGSVAKVMDRALETINVDVFDDHSTSERGRLLSYLPMSHVAERLVVEMNALYSNSELFFSAGLDSFVREIRQVQPTFFFSVPRLWAKFKAGVDASIPPQQQSSLDEEQKQVIRQSLGFGEARFLASSAAPLAADLHQWYLDMGMPLYEGYSMTETFGIGTAFLAGEACVPGCVGHGRGMVDVRISDAGEVLFKTEAAMLGYFENSQATSEVMDDGWYSTGDSGYLDEAGRLWVTGRMGSVFKTSKGKFINPESLEARFGKCAELGQLLIFGHGRDQPCLLANLSEYGATLERNELQPRLEALLLEVNGEVPPYERVSQLLITGQDWTIEAGLLTPTLKVKRKPVEQHFQAFIAASEQADPVVWQ